MVYAYSSQLVIDASHKFSFAHMNTHVLESQVKSNARSESILNFLTTSKPTQRRNASEDISGKRMSNASKSKAIDNNVADPNTSSTSKSKFESVGRQVNIRQNYVHELLVEKTIDATYALFCLGTVVED
jgi:hypothetical protein